MNTYTYDWTIIIGSMAATALIGTLIAALLIHSYKNMIRCKKIENRRKWSAIFIGTLIPTVLLIGYLIGGSIH